MNLGIASAWAVFFVATIAATCWRIPLCRARGRRCTDTVRATCARKQGTTWVHGDTGDEAHLARPVYRYEYDNSTYETAAGVATMLFEHSPTAARLGEAVELRVNPGKPTEVYDPDYESWFAKYRLIWGIAACAGGFALVNLLQGFG